MACSSRNLVVIIALLQSSSGFLFSRPPLKHLYRTKPNDIDDKVELPKIELPEISLPALPSELDTLKPWISTYSSRPQLVAGDTVGLLVFAAIGRGSHAESVDIIGTFLTAFPFIVGYFAAASPLGAYEKEATSSYASAASTLVPAWLAGTLGGVFLRSIGKLALPPTGFVVATSIFTFIFLYGPRAFNVFLETKLTPSLPSLEDIKFPDIKLPMMSEKTNFPEINFPKMPELQDED